MWTQKKKRKKKQYKQTCLQNRSRVPDVENKPMVTREWAGEGKTGRLELTYTHYYIWAPSMPQWLRIRCSAGHGGLFPELGRSPRGDHGNPLQYSCQENLMDKGTWWAMAYGVTKNQT